MLITQKSRKPDKIKRIYNNYKTNLKDFCKSTSIKNKLKLDVTIFKKNQQVNQNLILAATLKKRKNNKGQMTNIIIF